MRSKSARRRPPLAGKQLGLWRLASSVRRARFQLRHQARRQLFRPLYDSCVRELSSTDPAIPPRLLDVNRLRCGDKGRGDRVKVG